jgi:hypothetical protein
VEHRTRGEAGRACAACGLLDVLDPSAKLAGFVPRDPDKAGCLIELSEVHAAPDTQ